MDKGTPISHLRRGEDDDGGAALDNMVQDIEGDTRGGPMPGYDGEQDDDQDYDPRDPRDPRNRPPPGYGQQQQQQQQYQQGPPPGYGSHQGIQSHGNLRSLENAGTAQKIMSEAKEPLLVAVLVVILSSGQVNSLITRFLPMANSNPLIGLIVRALLAGVAFYLLRRFIPS